LGCLTVFREAEQRFLLLFLEKEELPPVTLSINRFLSYLGCLTVFREAEQRFLLLFWKKKNCLL
jgi:hypothetical protein